MTDAFDLEALDEPAPPPAAASEPAYLEGLNPEQRSAVEALDGPVLVLAGAGTGKTRVLTTRLAHLLTTGRAWPGQILCVTFTNKAAREMKERVAGFIGGAVEGMPWLGTFHSVAARMLRRHAEIVGLKSDFAILDVDDQLRLLKQVIAAADVDEKRWPARGLAALIDRWKNQGLGPDSVPRGEAFAYANGKGGELYKTYQERLRALNAADFGDLLLHTIDIFKGQPDLLTQYQERIKYILVDEYQDSNVAQYLWLRLLAAKRKNVCCVGDDDQSIYGWRGAEVGNILRFEDDFPGAQVIRLERNYRSTPHILGAASGLIAGNQGRLGKELWTDVSEGDKIRVQGLWDGEAEARTIAEEIDALRGSEHKLAEVAILVRASHQTREFEERFNLLGIPYRLVGGVRFYARLEIRDAVAYLRVAARADDDLAFERIVNKPKRGLGDTTVKALQHVARSGGMALTRAAAALLETDDIRPQARKALAALLENFRRWRELSQSLPHPELAEVILEESGYTEMWQNDKSADAPGRLENLSELVHAMAEFSTLEEFLDHVSLVMDIDSEPDADKVNLMTLHSAKGLEFRTVYLPGWEEELFPHQRALDEGGNESLEEERRLAYVGLTRAQERARVSFAANRHMFGQWRSTLPSRFIDELPDEHVERISEPGVYEQPRQIKGAGLHEGETFSAGFDAADYDFGEAAEVGYGPGDRVHHKKFGNGKVVEVDGSKLTVDFRETGRKKVIASFVRPA